MKIEKQPSIDVNEAISDRIERIFEVAKEYGMIEVVKKGLTINASEDSSKLSYFLDVSKIKFEQYPGFRMWLYEAAYADAEDLSVTRLGSYKYHGIHLVDPNQHFIRFDYEPLKKRYAPVHINANKKKWGDHLVFPDDTNLDISKMSFPIALLIFNRYAKDKDDFPTNKETNQPYVDIIDNRG